MKQDRLKQAYRRWFSQLDEKVPDEVWSGIEDELDLDDVWSGIYNKLHPARRLFFRKRAGWVAAAVLVVLVSGLAGYRYLFRQLPGTDQEERITSSNPDSNRPPSGQAPAREQEAGRKSTANGSSTPQQSAPDQPESLSAAGTLEPAPGQPAAGQRPYHGFRSRSHRDEQPVDGRLISRTASQLTMSLPEPNPTVIAPPPDRPGFSLRGSGRPLSPGNPPGTEKKTGIRLEQIGLVSAYNNTWLLNNETFNGLRASSLNSTNATYTFDAGLAGNFLINQRHRIGAELYFSSRTGQNYQEYINARYQNRNIQLNYYKLQLFYQLPVFSASGNGAGQTGLSGEVIAGGYLSYLSSGREKIGDQPRTVENHYRSLDYGLMTGFQLNLPVNRNLQLRPGFRINYGLPNIFKGNQTVPGNFLRTHNASAGFYIGLSYKFTP